MEIAIVTGAKGCIGQKICQKLWDLGYFTIELDLYTPTELKPSDNSKSIRLAIDLLSENWVKPLMHTLKSLTGNLSLIVHAAGVETDAPINDIESARKVFEVNFWPLPILTDLIVQVTLQAKQTTPRNLLTIGSFMAMRGQSGKAAYSCSKIALEAFIRNAAVELAQYQIRANAISPGWVDTPLAARAIEVIAEEYKMPASKMQDILRKKSPLKKFAQADEIAEILAFLLGPGAQSITGQILTVDNGLSVTIP